MSSAAQLQPRFAQPRPRTAHPWLQHLPLALLGAGLLGLYTPSVIALAQGLWQTDTHSHGPLVLAVALWLYARALRSYLAGDAPALAETAPPATPARPAATVVPGTAPTAGWALLLVGLLLYVLGRSQSFAVFDIGSLMPVMLGATLILFGNGMARRAWFAFVFMLFVIPLPGSMTDFITQPLKIGVSAATEQLLYWAGYPIARAGVTLTIGQYQLLVADACSGLNSLFMLEAFGLLYLNLVRHESLLRNAALAILIVPISFASNVTRVVVLSLVTHHFGDAIGQGFVHGFSGVVLFAAALGLIVAGDALLRVLARGGSSPDASAAVPTGMRVA